MRSKGRDLLTKLRTPAAAGVLAAALLLDWVFLPYESQAGKIRFALGLMYRRHYHPHFDLWQMHEDAGVLRVVHQDDAVWRTDTREAIAALHWRGRVTGFWAPTQIRCSPRLEFHPADATDAYDEDQIRRLVIEDYLRRWPEDAPRAAILRSARMKSTQILWTGVAHNVLSATAALLLLYSLSSARHWFAPARRRRRLRRGLCPRCRYNLAGLTGPLCPECGEELGAPAPPDGEHEAG